MLSHFLRMFRVGFFGLLGSLVALGALMLVFIRQYEARRERASLPE